MMITRRERERALTFGSTVTPNKPMSPILRHIYRKRLVSNPLILPSLSLLTSSGKRLSRSTLAAIGANSACAHSATDALSACCSSLRQYRDIRSCCPRDPTRRTPVTARRHILPHAPFRKIGFPDSLSAAPAKQKKTKKFSNGLFTVTLSDREERWTRVKDVATRVQA